MKIAELCAEIHKMSDRLPMFWNPRDVPFENGLYLFYERGETSSHAPDGRIVRIGNHPRSQNGLKRRLRQHYSGNKNSSVFRKFLGGAILRRSNPNHPCLTPGPGEGHWEKQDMPACERCKPLEAKVRELLRNNFWFRCVEVEDRELRNSLEKKLVATISLCPICKPSGSWLGRYAYSEKIRSSGLWNSDFVFDHDKTTSSADLDVLNSLIASTLDAEREYP